MPLEPPGKDANPNEPAGDGDRLASATVKRHGDLGTITLAGEFDLCSRQFLATRLGPLFDGSPVKSLEVDATAITFIDSTGLKALLAMRDAVISLGIEFSLDNASPQVWRVLDLAGLGDVLRTNGSAASAPSDPRRPGA